MNDKYQKNRLQGEFNSAVVQHRIDYKNIPRVCFAKNEECLSIFDDLEEVRNKKIGENKLFFTKEWGFFIILNDVIQNNFFVL